MNNLVIKGSIDFNGVLVPNIYGGFGPDQKAMTDKYIAEIHEIQSKHLRQDIKRLTNRFVIGIDYIDLKALPDWNTSSKKGVEDFDSYSEVLKSLGYSKQEIVQSKSLYLFSERGYIKLISGMNNSNDKKWEVMNNFIDGYYQMKESIENVISSYDRCNFRRYLNTKPNEYVMCEIDKYIEYQTNKNADTRLTAYKHAIDILNNRIDSLDIQTIEGSLYLPLFQKKLNTLTEEAWHLQVRMQAGRIAYKTTEVNILKAELDKTKQELSEKEQLLHAIPHYASIIQDDDDDLNWQIVTIHPFSVNNQKAFKNGRFVNSDEYNQWKHDADIAFRNSNIQSLESMGVDPHKPMRIVFRFCVRDKRFDTDNLIKSALDRVADYYGLKSDNNFVSIDSSKYIDTVEKFEHGEIRFAIRNLTRNEINSLLFAPEADDGNTVTVY